MEHPRLQFGILRRCISLCALVVLLVSAGRTAAAQTIVSAGVPVIGCTGAIGPINYDAEVDDDAAGPEDEQGEDDDRRQPIVGTLKAPPRTRDHDVKALGPLARITRDVARTRALAALTDAPNRRVRGVELGVEQGYVVYAVKTVMKTGASSPDPRVDLKVDAGNGQILLVECDPNGR